ncbi:unnamed protein product [Mytilus coruscus]|uniref:CCHC-type domain-containing protein n=1 Tax=Mytilus coruscus TaxID=42192 RepID=A0A6J8BTZ4_MYTCO|nr:unnamed protein product [Mytilus coruscus]
MDVLTNLMTIQKIGYNTLKDLTIILLQITLKVWKSNEQFFFSGKKTYKLMRNLSAPQKPGKKTYDDIVKLVTDHQNPKPSSIVQRCKFNSRSRQPKRINWSQFVAELRQISEHCDYEATLDDMLRDRLVCGIKEDRIQRRLLAEPGLTFKKAMEVATAMEMAAKNAHDLQVQEPKQVHKVTIRNEECYRCGGSHNATDCKWKDAKCYVCDKKGHLAKKCRNKGKQNAKGKPKFKQQTQQGKVYPKQRPTKTHFVEEDSDDMEDTYTMYQLEGTKRKPYLVSVKLNNTEINMEIDTGASVSVISQETCKQVFGSDNSLEKPPCSLRTYTGEKIDVLGKRKVTVIYNSQSVDLPITVVKGTGPSLMGRDWLHKLQLNWKSIFKIEQLSHNQNRKGQGVTRLVTTMENLLQGIPRVVVRVDDILITGSSKSEHLNNLETVLGKIQESGMRLNKDKCVFLAPEVVYLGHRIDQYGICPVESKVKSDHRGTGT